MTMKSLTKRLFPLTLAVALFAFPAAAQKSSQIPVGALLKADPAEIAKAQQMPATDVDIKRIPVLRTMLQQGAELYYMGERSGMPGFMLQKDGQLQFFYIAPDRQSLLFGAMFSAEGTNITAEQMNTVGMQIPQIKALLTSAAEKQEEIQKVGGGGGSDPQPASKSGPPELVSLSPGERLYQDFQGAVGVTMGQGDKPLVVMLVEPHCPFCKATWKELKDHVDKGELRVKLLPIGAPDSEDERQSAIFLRVAEPFKAWSQFVDGDANALAGVPPTADITAVRATMEMTKEWKISATPYIVYRGKDGKIKVVLGKPDKVATILSDLSP
ncbi:MAG: hypothetical protein WDO70_00520 [Alphaproteobacteria bacterium]